MAAFPRRQGPYSVTLPSQGAALLASASDSAIALYGLPQLSSEHGTEWDESVRGYRVSGHHH